MAVVMIMKWEGVTPEQYDVEIYPIHRLFTPAFDPVAART